MGHFGAVDHAGDAEGWGVCAGVVEQVDVVVRGCAGEGDVDCVALALGGESGREDVDSGDEVDGQGGLV